MRISTELHALEIPPLDYREVFAQVRELLGQEVRLDAEQRHLTAARAAYADLESIVHVPGFFPGRRHGSRRWSASTAGR